MQAVCALESEVTPGAQGEADAAVASGCLRVLARVAPFLVGDARLGCGLQSPVEGAECSGSADAALNALHAFLHGAAALPRAREEAEAEAEAEAETATAPSAAAVWDGPTETLCARLALSCAHALLCPGLSLSPRSSVWAPPLSPGAPSAPPDGECTPGRLDALRLLELCCAAEALAVPFAPPPPCGSVGGDADTERQPCAHAAHHFLSSFSGRGEGHAALPQPLRRRLLLSLLSGASSAPGLSSESPQGMALVVASARALLLLVTVAETDCPDARPEDAPALFAAMALPQAAQLHASLASLLADAARQAAGGDQSSLTAQLVGSSALLSFAPPPRAVPPLGASEALALALAATERAACFADVAQSRAGGGGWALGWPVLTLMVCLRDHASAQGFLRAGSFLLLTLSSWRSFALALNEPLSAADAPLASAAALGPPMPPGATRGDAVLAALASLLAYPLCGGAAMEGHTRALYAPLLALFLNVAPCLKGLSPPGAGSAMHLLAALAQPSVLLADADGAHLLRTALQAVAAVVERQGESNPALMGALLRHSQLLQDLQRMTIAPPVQNLAGEGAAGADAPPPPPPPSPPTPSDAPQCSEEAGAATAPLGEGLFGGLRMSCDGGAAWAPTEEWLARERATWPLPRLLQIVGALRADHSAWVASQPRPHVYAEAAWLATRTLMAGVARCEEQDAAPPRTYARTEAVTCWQARHAAGLALLAEPRGVDGPRVRRLQVSLTTLD